MCEVKFKEVCTVVRLLLFYRSVNNLNIDFGKLEVHKYNF